MPTSAVKPLYHVKNLTQIYGGRTTLYIEDLMIKTGSIFGLLGANGAGKTTLLKRLAFLEQASSGTLLYRGVQATAQTYASMRKHVVFVPQVPVLFSGSLKYNMEYPLKLQRVPANERQAKIDMLLESVGLSSYLSSAAQSLSGGEAQRASIARALAANPHVLLLDEPTANVDKNSRDILARLMQQLCQQGVSIVIATHDVLLAQHICTDMLTLEDGRILSSDTSAG